MKKKTNTNKGRRNNSARVKILFKGYSLSNGRVARCGLKHFEKYK